MHLLATALALLPLTAMAGGGQSKPSPPQQDTFFPEPMPEPEPRLAYRITPDALARQHPPTHPVRMRSHPSTPDSLATPDSSRSVHSTPQSFSHGMERGRSYEWEEDDEDVVPVVTGRGEDVPTAWSDFAPGSPSRGADDTVRAYTISVYFRCDWRGWNVFARARTPCATRSPKPIDTR